MLMETNDSCVNGLEVLTTRWSFYSPPTQHTEHPAISAIIDDIATKPLSFYENWLSKVQIKC